MRVDPSVLLVYERVVVDTNVLLSAALSPNGTPATLLDSLLQVGKLVFSAATFAELEGRIWLPKFDRYLPMDRRRRLLHELNACSIWVDVPPTIAARQFSRDVNDDVFIHTAITAGVSRLVTGDDDLLCLHPLDGLHILSPRQALEELTR
ncbi:MAG: hypothetical protein FD128_2582 [Hyphomonadaceae bacterium]|nr:MAG: hypothetical protein FD128_2582 [Hyphomonadaceae bacterium]